MRKNVYVCNVDQPDQEGLPLPSIDSFDDQPYRQPLTRNVSTAEFFGDTLEVPTLNWDEDPQTTFQDALHTDGSEIVDNRDPNFDHEILELPSWD